MDLQLLEEGGREVTWRDLADASKVCIQEAEVAKFVDNLDSALARVCKIFTEQSKRAYAEIRALEGPYDEVIAKQRRIKERREQAWNAESAASDRVRRGKDYRLKLAEAKQAYDAACDEVNRAMNELIDAEKKRDEAKERIGMLGGETQCYLLHGLVVLQESVEEHKRQLAEVMQEFDALSDELEQLGR